ncbi:D-xylulose 5-phosphate/D-fructose 6-phosphate phosphoketolase [Ramaria rubella]|nr:D-xylulose 5-phosphate/D-fructose 6-phosphate phosphoketolase [Ramaria rubella]
MPGQQLEQPNPSPESSSLPRQLRNLKVNLDIAGTLNRHDLRAVKAFRRAACFISAGKCSRDYTPMLFLKHNTLLEHRLRKTDIKPRILGHWGTNPGLILCWAHCNLLIQEHDINMFFVTGPGHGAPGILSCLWLEGSLARFMPEYSLDRDGLHKLITGFSRRSGFPSHVNAETPGSIHEGIDLTSRGELGYALAVSFGAVMDNPDLIVTCVIGDGEAETGPTAAAWHGYKYLDPAESGAIIPIVHVNGFKISQRTIYGCMDDLEIVALFSGYGYQVRVVEDLQNIDDDMAASLDWALREIKKIQRAARSGSPILKPRWPILILRTPKVPYGMSGPKELHGEFIEGSFNSHGIPLPNAADDDEEFHLLNSWLTSYKPRELFDKHGAPIPDILSIIPKHDDKKMGQRHEAYADYKHLDVPDWKKFAVEKGSQQSCMHTVGDLLHDVIEMNPRTFRIWCPDELVSNKFEQTLRDTGRNFQWDVASRNKGGRVIEILSEHTCQGRTGLFPSYESFLGIVHTMVVQYSKFVKKSMEVPWRRDISSINYVETSTWARQEHNGFSHQNPSFIGAILNLKSNVARVYLPPDANCFLSTMAHCLRAKHYVNLMVGSKHPTPAWLSPEEADKHCIAGASVWKMDIIFIDVAPSVLVGIGIEMTMEVLAAASLLRKMSPDLRVRVVNVTDLMILSPHGYHPHALSEDAFDGLFTKDKFIHFNYHGYPIELKGLLSGRPGLSRISIEGYREEGTTTTPFDMMLSNHVSRFHVAVAAIRGGAVSNPKVSATEHALVALLLHEVETHRRYAYENGEDMKHVYDVPGF